MIDGVDLIYDMYRCENARINREFDNAYYELSVYFYDNKVMTESVSEPLGASIKKFFANLITAIRNYINKLKSYFGKSAREASYKATLNSIEKQIRDAKAAGKTKVTMLDYKLIRSEYDSMCKDLKKYGKKFVKMRYTSTIDIDRDLESFMKISESWDTRMEKVIKKTKTMSVDDALKFVENEKRGYTHIFDNLNEAINQIDEIRHVAEETASRVSTLGSDIIPKHVNFLRRVANSISNKVTKFASKTVAVTVLLFA